jgi:hypothetical protein
MTRSWSLAVLGGWLVLTATASAQNVPAKFRWQAGQTLHYRIEQVTTASETVGDTRDETTMRLNQTKRWQVAGVDAQGVATLQMSLVNLRFETTTPSGDKLVFDSTRPEQSDPQLREQWSKFVGVPLAVLRIDGTGRVIEVKDCKFGSPSRFENEAPFAVTLAPAGLQAGQRWERPFQITLDPPQGTGEKFQAVQHFLCKSVEAGQATILLATSMKTVPQAIGDQVPLLQFQPEGEVTFDVQQGILKKATLKIDKTLKGHQGEESVYQLKSSYVEEFAGSQ